MDASALIQGLLGSSTGLGFAHVTRSTPARTAPPTCILHFSSSENATHDPLEMTFELELAKLKRDDQQTSLFAIGTFDGEPYVIDLSQVERLVCVGASEREHFQDRPPFVRLVFPFVCLQLHLALDLGWNTAIKKLHRFVIRLLREFDSSVESKKAGREPELAGGRANEMERHYPIERKTLAKRKEPDVDDRGQMRGKTQKIKEEGTKDQIWENEKSLKQSTGDEDDRSEELALSTQDLTDLAYGHDWPMLLDRFSQLGQFREDKELIEIKQLICGVANRIPPCYSCLFPSDESVQASPRGASASIISKLAELFIRCQLAPAQLNALKRKLADEKKQLETYISKTMPELFPQGSGRAARKVADPNLLVELHRRMEQVCEQEVLINVLWQRGTKDT